MSAEKSKPPTASVVVTRESSARTQLDTAIYLWFLDGDPISIHTLAWAALQVITDTLARDKSGKTNKPTTFIASLRQEGMSDAQRRQAELPAAFAKHADRRMQQCDGVGYHQEYTEEIMYDGLMSYGWLYDHLSPWMRLFAAKFMMANPDSFPPAEIPKSFERLGSQEQLARLGRREFLEKVLPNLSREDLGMPPELPRDL